MSSGMIHPPRHCRSVIHVAKDAIAARRQRPGLRLMRSPRRLARSSTQFDLTVAKTAIVDWSSSLSYNLSL
nr:hypothetical protein CFP56_76654 [Quercus suber]